MATKPAPAIQPRNVQWYGLRADAPDRRDHDYTPSAAELLNLPPSVDLRQHCPPVMDQGPLGSCTVHGITTALRYALIKQGQADRPLSRLQCFPGDTLVETQSNAVGATRRFYEGDVVILRTASGRHVTCTPNHPILTVAGWRHAKLIDVGDDLIGVVGAKSAAPRAVDQDNQHVPSTIKEVADALFVSGNFREVPVATPDFHGDGAGSEVAVVASNGHLRRQSEAAPHHFFDNLSIYWRNVREGFLLHGRAMGVLFRRVLSPFGIEAAPHDNGLALAGVSPVPNQFDVVGLTPKRDAAFSKYAPDGAGPNAQISTNLPSGSTGEILPDNRFADVVVSRSVERFHGHVYNLHTREGCYIANGLVVHNCYYDERGVEGTIPVDSGAEIRTGIKCAARIGVAHESLWPYDVTKFKRRPLKAVYADALKFEALEYKRVQINASHVKAALAANFPVVIGLNIYAAFEGDQVASNGVVPMPGPNDAPAGGHCLICVGYGQHSGYFTVMNSWGADWADKGFCYFPEEYIGDPSFGSDYWIITALQVKP